MDGEFFAETDLEAGAVDFLLDGALLFVDAGLVEAGFVFADLGLVDAGFAPVTDFLGDTLALEVFLPTGLALTAAGFAFALGGETEAAFFFGAAW